MTNTQRIQMFRTMAMDAHYSSVDAHGYQVAADIAWEFITQSDDKYDSLIGTPIPRVFAVHYAAWGRDFKRAQGIAKCDECGCTKRDMQLSGISDPICCEVVL